MINHDSSESKCTESAQLLTSKLNMPFVNFLLSQEGAGSLWCNESEGVVDVVCFCDEFVNQLLPGGKGVSPD